jgi:hypothetical protein
MLEDPLHVYRLIIFLFDLGLIITTLELLFIAPEFDSGGIFSWKIHRLEWGFFFQKGSVGQVLNLIYSKEGLIVSMTARLVCLVMLFFVPLKTYSFTIYIGITVLITLIFWARQSFGGDGSDQMFSIIAITLLLCVNPFGTSFSLESGLWFIALQSCLSYFAAGIAKLISPKWRSGEAVYAILNTGSYGVEFLGQFLASRTKVKLLLSWTVIAMEILFPLVLILPSPFQWLFLGWGFSFHLANAIFMGLNTFLWAFVATYPAILFVSTYLKNLVG